MPAVNKQKNDLLSAPAPTRNGVLGRAVPVAKLPQAPLKVLMFGGNRTGKTTLACQFAKPLLLISFEQEQEGGAASVKNTAGVSFIRVVSNNSPALAKRKAGEPIIGLDEYTQMMVELQNPGHGFATVVCDGATSMQEVVLANIMELPAVPTQNSWGTVSPDQYRERSEKTRNHLKPLLDLPIDTVILAKERDHNPPEEKKVTRSGKESPDMRAKFLRGLHQGSYVATDLGGATVGWLQDCCSCLCRLYVEEEVKVETMDIEGQKIVTEIPTGKYIRKLRIGPPGHPNYGVGVRDPNGMLTETPVEVIERPTAAKLLKVLRG